MCGGFGNVYLYLLCFVLFVLCLVLFRLCLFFVVCILLGISPASDCDLPTFRNPLSVPTSKARCRRRGNTQKNTYNIQNTAKV
jgi:hypothetical protein